MKKDDFITEVMFRKETRDNDFKGEIFALFPYVIETFRGECSSYAHAGQHSMADYTHCIQSSMPAKEIEYKDLKAELESEGYNLKVISRRNYDRYLKEYKKVRNVN